MIRGAIEQVTEDAIVGWLHSPELDLRGRTLLAFLDGECIGAGEVGLFREDIRDAGLGDGHAGFHFGLTYDNRADAGRIVVAFDWCDVVLMQKGARVAAPARRPNLPGPLARAA